MKTLNRLISDYTAHLQQGEIQTAYKGILEFVNQLRTHYSKSPCYDTGSLYQGYMDMTYFSLSTKPLKDRGLKIAIVYLHEKGAFEVWLSARTREISKRYESIWSRHTADIPMFHDMSNQDAIVEFTVASTPNFEDQNSLIHSIEQNVQKFVAAITNRLELSPL